MLNHMSYCINQFKELKRKNSTLQFDASKIIKVYKNQTPPSKTSPFTDDLFPPNSNSILAKDIHGNYIDETDGPRRATYFNLDEIEWKRASEIFPHPLLFEGTINVDDIRQGKIGNCYFLSALAALCEFPSLISQLFITKDISPTGCYQVILFIDGEYQIVFLDDYFPVLKGTNVLYFAKPNSFELWVLLLEKAWAKINGGYANIISGWPSDVFRAVTGFACEQLTHRDNTIERLWSIIRTVDTNYGIICVSTRNDDIVTQMGLVQNHAYTLIDTEEVKDKDGNCIRLCLLRNPWGYKEWIGDWSEDSLLWSNDIKNQIEFYNSNNNSNNIKGSFWICIEDIMRYFLRTDICQIVYGSRLRFFDYTPHDLQYPQVLNVYLPEKGILSVSVIEKNWRYNRKLKDVAHPTSLIIAEYDPLNKTITRSYADYDCYQDAEKSRILNKGYYIIWFYKAYDLCHEPKPEFVRVKIACDVDNYTVVKINTPDKDFHIIREIIAQCIKHNNNINSSNSSNSSDMFYDISNPFNKSGIAYRIAINPLSNRCQKWYNDASKIENITLLPPYTSSSSSSSHSFEFWVPPKGYGLILGIQNDQYGTHWFNIESKVETYECDDEYEPDGVIKVNFDTFCKGDIHLLKPECDFITSSFDVLSTVVKYPTVDHNAVWINNLTNKYPFIMNSINELKPVEKEYLLNWVVLMKKNGMYVGQASYTTREGRGGFYYSDDGTMWVGYWEGNNKGKYGKMISKDGKVMYEGEYKNGKRNGYGRMNFNSGEWYEGEFKDGKREGKGVFHWDKECYWEGMFKENEMNGMGVYHEGRDSWEVGYDNGRLIE